LGRRRDEREHQNRGRDWDSTPRSERDGTRSDAPSVRVPNVPWDNTPRNTNREGDGGWGNTRTRRWDAPTPRAARGSSPEGSEDALGLDVREWEEEQIKLDRDWYNVAEGGVTGDEEHNPLSQYEDLGALREAEIAHKQTVGSLLFTRHLRRRLDTVHSAKFLRSKPNTYDWPFTRSGVR
jgi:pre-mRNA-splicing factor ATP-dependent RNA helicase DHX38/PRP16